MTNKGARLKGLMGLPGWQPPCLRTRGSFCSCQSGNEGVTVEERERKVCPSTLHPLSPSLPLSSLPSRSGEPCHPPDATAPWSSGPPSATECRPSGASASPRRALPTRRGVPVFPYSRFAAPESALHRRRINTGRHPNSLEVNASFPRTPTTSTSYLPYPTTSLQKPDEGSRPWGGDFHLGRNLCRLRLYGRDNETAE